MHETTGWAAAIDRLYESVGQEERLAAALGDFREFFDARGVTFLSTPDPMSQQSAHVGAIGVSPESLVAYHSHFNRYDAWVQAAWVRDKGIFPGATYRGTDLVPRRDLQRSYFWKSFLVPHGVSDVLCCVVEAPGAASAASFVSFYRHAGDRKSVV